MESKKLITFFTVIGGWAGGYIPLLWGASAFSFSSIFCSAIGAFLGIWIGFRLSQ